LSYTELLFAAELARDSLERTGKYEVIQGIISPVSDAYPKKVCYIHILLYMYIFSHLVYFFINICHRRRQPSKQVSVKIRPFCGTA